MNKDIIKLGDKFACLTRYTVGRSRRTAYFAESRILDDGRHFMCEGDTPAEAIRELVKSVRSEVGP